jgi:HemX protein
MPLLTDRNYFLFAVLVYGVSMLYSVFLWRRGFRQDNRVNYCLILAGFALHTTAMFKRGFSMNQCPVNNLYEATMFVSWTMAAIYLVVGIWSRLRFLGAFASPFLFAIGIFALMPALDPPHGPKPEFTGGWFSLHVALFALAYGALGLSSVAGCMFLTQDHDLKHHKLRAVLSLLPPIERLEHAMTWLMLSGFALLTAALAVSLIWFQRFRAEFGQLDPKIIWSVAVWAMCCGLVLLRWKMPQSARRFAWGTIGIFVFVALTFWGASLMSPSHNNTPAKATGSSPAPIAATRA